MLIENKKYFLIPILATTSFASSNNIIKNNIKLVTSPDELISKDIIRSEIINDYEFKLKLKNLEKATKSQELELKRLMLENKKLDITSLQLNNQKLSTELENKKINFEITKENKKEELFEKYPYTFLNFIPGKIDLLNNIIKGKIEKTKLDNLEILKEMNLENIKILKLQYNILGDLNTKSNQFYINLVNYDLNGIKETLFEIDKNIEKLFNTNILYVKKDFIELSQDFTRIKTLTTSFIVDARNNNNQKAQKEYQEINDVYQNFEQTLLKIKEKIINKLIELKQTNNLKIVNNEIKITKEQPTISPDMLDIKSGNKSSDEISKLKNLVKTLKTNRNTRKKVLIPKFRFSSVLTDKKALEYARKQLAIEMGVPVKYLSYLSPRDIYEIQTAANKANLLKTILLKIEVDKDLTKDEVKVLQEVFKDKTINGKSNKLYIKYKIIDKINSLLKKKYLLLQQSIARYKEKLRREAIKRERLKKLELQRARIEAEKRARLAEIEKERRMEELRMQREMERRKRIERQKRLMKLKIKKAKEKIENHITETFRKYTFIGIINNSISLQNKTTGEVIYIHPGSILNGIKIQNILDYNQGIIKVNYKGITKKINLLTSSSSMGMDNSNMSMNPSPANSDF